VVEFARTTSGVAEGEVFVEIPLRLSAPSEHPISVTCVVIGGSTDESDSARELPRTTFAPGQTEAMVPIRIHPDDWAETSETVQLGLIEAENATLKGRKNHTVVICRRSYQALGGAHYFRYDSNERWEKFAKVGPYADAMIRLMPGHDRLVFWRGSSYLPFLEIAGGKSFAEIEVPQNGDGEGLRFDRFCKHAQVRIVENSSARVRVLWRYVPDMRHADPASWTEEIFTVYPDGTCYRSVFEGTESFRNYRDPSHPRTDQLLLTKGGIVPMPRNWVQAISLAVDEATLRVFDDRGFDRTQGCYVLETRNSGVPGAIKARLVSSVKNPALYIGGWGNAEPEIAVDGEAFDDARTGINRRMDANDLVVWLKGDLPTGAEIEIRPSGGIPPMRRRPVEDPYLSEVPLLPKGSPDPGPFGAFYTTLRYWEEWDRPWRTGAFADVVVQFDRTPDRLVFWRGTTYVPHWVNERNFWYSNEFCERRGRDSGIDGLCEPMQDHDSRFSRVRIIHSTPARALVHWRYAPTTLSHQFFGVDHTGWGDWVDDYYYVYPDETCVRDTTLYTSKPNVFHEWHEAIPLINPGMIPEEILEPVTLAVANTAGKSRSYDFSKGFPPDDEFEDGMNIVLVRLKGEGKPFAIAESHGVWWDPISRPEESLYNHYDDWPAWPEKYRRADWDRDPETGYREFSRFLPSHSSLMHLNWDNYESRYGGPFSFLRRIFLNGMTHRDDVTALIPLARFWENAPPVVTVGYGFSPACFEKSQKAYLLSRRISWDPFLVNRDDDRYPNPKADKVDLRILASAESPLLNPAFVVRNWPADTRAGLSINGESVPSGKQFRQGVERNWDQSRAIDSLVVWVECQFEEPVTITMEME
jgi:hypothetical protein